MRYNIITTKGNYSAEVVQDEGPEDPITWDRFQGASIIRNAPRSEASSHSPEDAAALQHYQDTEESPEGYLAGTFVAGENEWDAVVKEGHYCDSLAGLQELVDVFRLWADGLVWDVTIAEETMGGVYAEYADDALIEAASALFDATVISVEEL